MSKWCNTIIRWGFYLLFFSVPLFFQGDTSELFELNKMWLTFWIAIVIIGAWLINMAIQKRFYIQRTILDIPIILFLISQIISTIFSIDSYVSFWGYYSRFNGGLLSTITYIALYYALVSHLKKTHILRLLWISLASGVIVALWGLPSHFGYDPTCYIFTRAFDVSCWTADFQPKARIFSTLGQPDWMAAYLCILLPISMAFGLWKLVLPNRESLTFFWQKNSMWFLGFFILTGLFYLDLTYTNTRAGSAAFWIVFILFFIILFFLKNLSRRLAIQATIAFILLIGIITFLNHSPISLVDRFTLPSLIAHHQSASIPPVTSSPPTSNSTTSTVAQAKNPAINITDSGTIRLYVWQGALAIWRDHPLFGTGVETYAFAYYLYRPIGHNMTSEWDFLYNKAHNEYLNYLATTGIFGLGTYLIYILIYLFLSCFYLWKYAKDETRRQDSLLVLALLMGYITMLITNFFGFSVVIINLYIFLMPAFFLVWTEALQPQKLLVYGNKVETQNVSLNAFQWTGIVFILLIASYFELILFTDWFADKQYAMGYNLDSVQHYSEAYPYLTNAVSMRPDEPVFQDELSVNEAALAAGYVQAKDITDARKYAASSKSISDTLIATYPNNLLFFKSRARIFYLLAQGDPTILQYALQAIQQANLLAPTDAKVLYNLGVLYAQTGNIDQGITTLKKTIQYKPDYRDAYYALALFYHQKATDKAGKVIDQATEQKAVDLLHYILNHLSPSDADAIKTLKTWNAD